MARNLGAVRISHLTDETTSPERQREQITLTTQARGDTLVRIVEDLDVSGAVSPFDRDDLGPWLTDPELIGQWDNLVVAKLDRLTRSLRDFDDFRQWCDAHGKSIVSVSESIDLSTSHGRMFANLLAMFAQFERERMSERRRERAQSDKANGWFGGGRTKYGFRAVKTGDHYEVEEHPDEVAVIGRMAGMLLKGRSAADIARTLTAEGIPTKLGVVKKEGHPREGQPREWAGSTVLDILSDPETPLDEDTWGRVQATIRDASRPKGHRYDAGMLAGVAVCGICGTEMWMQHTRRGDMVWDYYRCYAKCGAKMVRAGKLESLVDDMLATVEFPVTERKLIPGSDKSKKLAEIDRAIGKLNPASDTFMDEITALHAARKRTEAAPAEPDRYEVIDTGQTVGQMWLSLDCQGKRAWLLDHHWQVKVTAGDKRGDDPQFTLVTPLTVELTETHSLQQ